MNVGIVYGTRPEILKNYSIIKALKRRNINFWSLYTNQHNSYCMKDVFFREMNYYPDFTLSDEYEIGTAICWVREMIKKLDLNLIIVNGDTAASLIGSIAAMYSDIKIAHVEAGLRSFDPLMPEERNRIMVDAVSHYLFAYTSFEEKYLNSNQEIRGEVFCTGNTTVDLIEDFIENIVEPKEKKYAFVTLHRKNFTENKEQMIDVFSTINYLACQFDQIIFPIHPRTKGMMKQFGINSRILDRVNICNPMSAFKFLSYEKFADIILTDSGCVQEEAYLFGTPCVTIRENTERHLTVTNGANVVCGFQRKSIIRAVEKQREKKGLQFPNIYGDYGAGERIVSILAQVRQLRGKCGDFS